MTWDVLCRRLEADNRRKLIPMLNNLVLKEAEYLENNTQSRARGLRKDEALRSAREVYAGEVLQLAAEVEASGELPDLEPEEILRQRRRPYVWAFVATWLDLD